MASIIASNDGLWVSFEGQSEPYPRTCLAGSGRGLSVMVLASRGEASYPVLFGWLE